MNKMSEPRKYQKGSIFGELGGASIFPAHDKQAARLVERKQANSYISTIKQTEFKINPGVYRTGIDTELMIDAIKIEKSNTFLEIGCGCGAISIFLAKKSKYGVCTDINSFAVYNTIENCALNRVKNLFATQTDVFDGINGKFDIIVCNPPYNEGEVHDNVDRMFWDPANSMKLRFFQEVSFYLNPSGKIYFGWADFADIDFNLPIRAAERNGLILKNYFSRPSKDSFNRFIVFEFVKSFQLD